MRAAVTAIGHYVPPDVYANDHFAKRLDTTDEWIRSRTGIVERRFAATGGSSDLAVAAARRCLEARGIPATALDGILVATMTPNVTGIEAATATCSRPCATACAITSYCGVSPRIRAPSAITASGCLLADAIRAATTGNSNAPGTQST